MMFSLLGPLWPYVRSCGSGDGPTPSPFWIIVLTVALYTALAVRGSDMMTVAAYAVALVANAMVLIGLARGRLAMPPTVRGGHG